MASKIAVIKLLEEKTESRLSELAERYQNAIRESNNRMAERGEELFVAFTKYLESNPLTIPIPNQDKRKKAAAVTFFTHSFGYNKTPSEMLNADPVYLGLRKERVALEQKRDSKMNDIRLKAKRIKEAIIFTGIPDNIRELMSEFDEVSA